MEKLLLNESPRTIFDRWAKTMQEITDRRHTFLLLGKAAHPMTNDYRLTNPVWSHGTPFSSVEIAYKFSKYNLQPGQEIDASEDQKKFLIACQDSRLTPALIRILERKMADLVISPEWSEKKLLLMYSLNLQKFTLNPGLRQMLIDTCQKEIIAPSFSISPNGQPWSDQVYEVLFDEYCKRIGGQNIMGQVLMRVRGELQDS